MFKEKINLIEQARSNLEDVGATILNFAASIDEQATEMRAIEAQSLRSALRLVPKPTIGFEHIHERASVFFSQFDSTEVSEFLSGVTNHLG